MTKAVRLGRLPSSDTARPVESLKPAAGVPTLEAVAVVVWQSLRLAGVDPARGRGRGRLLQEPHS